MTFIFMGKDIVDFAAESLSDMFIFVFKFNRMSFFLAGYVISA